MLCTYDDTLKWMSSRSLLLGGPSKFRNYTFLADSDYQKIFKFYKGRQSTND